MSTSPPPTGKRAASPLSPETAQTSAKRVKEEHREDGEYSVEPVVAKEESASDEVLDAQPGSANGDGNGSAEKEKSNGNGAVKEEAGDSAKDKDGRADKMDEDHTNG